MSDSPEETVAEGAVSGNQASIPAAIRERANIEDGDRLRWYWEDGDLSVRVVRRRSGVFTDFDGFEGDDDRIDHDAGGLNLAGERDARPPQR